MQWLAQTILKLLGWKTVYAEPPAKHGIIIVYPHTSNWDFLFGILWKFAVNTKPRWVAKDSWFRFPLGGLMRRLGGIGIRRDGGLDITTQLRDKMLSEPECWLAIAPEGTRARKDYIHMGYYHIARAANIPIGIGFIDYKTNMGYYHIAKAANTPIGIGFIDYKTKTVGVRGYRMIESDLSAELEQLVTDFKDIHAYNPTQASALKVRPAK